MKKFIAGEYKQQREYRSFTPSFINNPFVWDSPQIDILLEKAGRFLGELNAYAELIPDVGFFIRMKVVKEARDSNLIEGTKTELDEILLPQEEINPEKRDDWDEVPELHQSDELRNSQIARASTLYATPKGHT